MYIPNQQHSLETFRPYRMNGSTSNPIELGFLELTLIGMRNTLVELTSGAMTTVYSLFTGSDPQLHPIYLAPGQSWEVRKPKRRKPVHAIERKVQPHRRRRARDRRIKH